jgi:hypothetical protein
MTESAILADRPDDRTLCLWDQAAKAIIPTLEYAQSLEATPIYSITRWIPPAGLRLATAIVLEAAGKTGVEIAYENGIAIVPDDAACRRTAGNVVEWSKDRERRGPGRRGLLRLVTNVRGRSST